MTTRGRVPLTELPPPVRRALLALQTSLHHHTDYKAVQVTFLAVDTDNEYVKPIIDVRSTESEGYS